MIDVQKLDEGLKNLAKELEPFNRTTATLKIKLFFSEFFSDKSHFCYASSIPNNDYSKIHGEHEFIYDFIAVEEDLETRHSLTEKTYLTKSLLALETELNDNLDDVIDDFQKLLVCNSEEKVLVFKCHSSELPKWLSYFETSIELYKGGNGTFHLVYWINNEPEKGFTRKSVSVPLQKEIR